MAFSTSTIQPVAPANNTNKTGLANDVSALLSLLVLSVYAANRSKKEIRKLKRKFIWTALKLKIKSFFAKTKNKRVTDRVLIYILLGVVLLALLFIEPIAALVVVLVALILLLAGVI